MSVYHCYAQAAAADLCWDFAGWNSFNKTNLTQNQCNEDEGNRTQHSKSPTVFHMLDENNPRLHIITAKNSFYLQVRSKPRLKAILDVPECICTPASRGGER